jgi:hypothetical protein
MRRPSSVTCVEVKNQIDQRIQDNKHAAVMKLHLHESPSCKYAIEI